jgi:nifR3 family TIM-barrel protein
MNSLKPTLFIESQQPDIAFRVREVPVYGRLVLAPMDGLSDRPFRSLTRRLGSAMSYSEFINTVDILYGTPHIEKKLSFYPYEHPIVIQIFDDDPERMLRGALKVRQRNPDILDVNLGCSAKTVTHRGAGAALLKTPDKIAQIISSLVKHLDIPVTAKIRLGWDDDSRNYLQIAHILEDNGAALIAVHGRTKKQGYTGQADWDAIAAVKQAVHIPVLANGDVRTQDDIRLIFDRTGCDGVMIGRGAMDNPWIFSGRDRHEIPDQEVLNTMLFHLDEMVAFYGEERGPVLFRKYAKRILMATQISQDQLTRLLTEPDHNQVRRLLAEQIGQVN